MALVKLLGDNVNGKDGAVIETSSLPGKAEYIGLYFSAHWCPPCRGFTPKLAEFYEKFTKASPGKLEIVFVSSDQDESQFNDYYAEMPWLALPFADRAAKAKLCEDFKVSGIPTLIFLKSSDASVVCKQGRQAVMTDPEGEEFPWNA